jgi:hypothetical protein
MDSKWISTISHTRQYKSDFSDILFLIFTIELLNALDHFKTNLMMISAEGQVIDGPFLWLHRENSTIIIFQNENIYDFGDCLGRMDGANHSQPRRL